MNKKDLRIVFLGTPEFAVESLRRIVEGGYNVVGAVTMPDKPAGRGHRLYQSPVKEYALNHDIPVLQPVRLKDPEFIENLRSMQADLFIVIAFRMLPEVVWTMPRLGTFNLHASLLPQYRGAAPINRAVMNGETKTGVTTFMLKHEIDTGDILRQEAIEIGPEENVGSVHDRLMQLGADLVIDTIENILKDTLQPLPQDRILKGAAPTPAPKIFKEDCRIDWTRTAAEIHNHIRGLSPYPAAWTIMKGDNTPEIEMKIMTAVVSDIRVDAAPGSVIVDGGRLIVACGGGAVEIKTLRPAGKKLMDADAYLRGARLVNPRML